MLILIGIYVLGGALMALICRSVANRERNSEELINVSDAHLVFAITVFSVLWPLATAHLIVQMLRDRN